MTLLDWFVIVLYLGGIIAFAVIRGRSQVNVQDYYLANRGIRWWESGASTMATQLGAISFVSAPAFVAIKEGGGLKWLAYEFGVPLGLLLVMMVILPILHRGNHISIYEYLEQRFDRGTRTLVSILFQLGRGLATAVSVLAGGIIISTALPVSTVEAIIIVGVVTVIYDALGGIRVVILSDFLQMIVIALGILICGGAALWLVGWEAAWQALSPERFRILDFERWGLTPEGEYAFWPMAIGGFFLYASYYGCDQSQVQRELTVGNLRDVRRSLLVNVFGRFPMVLLYCVMGVLGGAVFTSPDLLGQLASALDLDAAGVTESLQRDPDRMVPMFILAFLPPGVVGLIFVAILSALMSSLDSGINSLSAATMQDIYRVHIKREASDRHYLIASKITTLFWGAFCVVAAIAFAQAGEGIRQTSIVLINAVGSLLYGPILAAFLLGMVARYVTAFEIKAGIVTGIFANIALWQLTTVSWLWWNFVGFAVTLAVTGILWLVQMGRTVPPALDEHVHYSAKSLRISPRIAGSVITYFFVIVLISFFIQQTR
ncbi:MAG: sodium/solute symporter [Bacteroidota bacterium]